MAQALAQDIFKANDIDIAAYSAGISAFGSSPASKNALTIMVEEGLDLSGHKSQPISPKLLNDAALILAMTAGHLTMVKSICQNINAFTLMEYANNAKKDITDPFGGDLDTYRATAKQIKELLMLCVEKFAGLTEL